jgi:hypothetical protein
LLIQQQQQQQQQLTALRWCTVPRRPCCGPCTHQVPRLLYEESMKGVRKYLVRHVWDGAADMSIVTEARADTNTGMIFDTNNRFEHLTCFAGGMFILGECLRSACARGCTSLGAAGCRGLGDTARTPPGAPRRVCAPTRHRRHAWPQHRGGWQ